MSSKEDKEQNNNNFEDYDDDDDDVDDVDVDDNSKGKKDKRIKNKDKDIENEKIYMMDLFIDYYKKSTGLIKFLRQRINNKKNKSDKDDDNKNYKNGSLLHELLIEDMKKTGLQAKNAKYMTYESMCHKLAKRYIYLIKDNKIDEKYKTVYSPKRKIFDGIKIQDRKRMVDVLEYEEEIDVFFSKGVLMTTYYHQIFIHPNRSTYIVLFKFVPRTLSSSSSSNQSLREKPKYFKCWDYFFFIPQDINLICSNSNSTTTTNNNNNNNNNNNSHSDSETNCNIDHDINNGQKIEQSFVRINDMEKSFLSLSLYPETPVIKKVTFVSSSSSSSSSSSTQPNSSSGSSATILFDNHVMHMRFIEIFKNFTEIATNNNRTVDIEEFDVCFSDFMELVKSLADKIYSLKQQHRQCHMNRQYLKGNGNGNGNRNGNEDERAKEKEKERENERQASDIERDIYFLRNILVSSIFYACCIDNTIGNNRRAFDFLNTYKNICQKVSPQMYMYYLLEILLSAFYSYRSFNKFESAYIDNIRVECMGLLKIYYSNLRDRSNPMPDRYSFMEVLFSDLI
jgi:hypothetical protein